MSLRPSGPAHAGDQIVLSRAVAFLQANHPCTLVLLERGGSSRKLMDVLGGAPPELSGYVSAQDRRTLAVAIAEHRPDRVVVLHEGLFPLRMEIAQAKRPCTLLAHNLLSRFTYGNPVLDALGGWAARRFERRWYVPGADDRLVFLSHGDRRAALNLFGQHHVENIGVALPGAPPATPLSDDAIFLPELVLTGSYAWWRKRRDLKAFARTAPPLPIHVFDASAVQALPQGRLHNSLGELDWSSRLRIGVVSDRFVGGFKLKALEYVARNCPVYAFAPIAEEFAGLPFANLFVQTAQTGDLRGFIKSLQTQERKSLVEKFRIFKVACLARFNWDAQLLSLDAGGRNDTL